MYNMPDEIPDDHLKLMLQNFSIVRNINRHKYHHVPWTYTGLRTLTLGMYLDSEKLDYVMVDIDEFDQGLPNFSHRPEWMLK